MDSERDVGIGRKKLSIKPGIREKVQSIGIYINGDGSAWAVITDVA